MSSRIDRTPRVSSARNTAKSGSRKPAEHATPNLPVPVSPAVTHPTREPTGESVLEAQLYGQVGERRGLRAGEDFIARANRAYNKVEWSGSRDRRARKGRQAREDV